MIFDGIIMHLDIKKLDKIYCNIATVSANVNQIAVRINSTGSIYADDLADIRKGYVRDYEGAEVSAW